MNRNLAQEECFSTVYYLCNMYKFNYNNKFDNILDNNICAILPDTLQIFVEYYNKKYKGTIVIDHDSTEYYIIKFNSSRYGLSVCTESKCYIEEYHMSNFRNFFIPNETNK